MHRLTPITAKDDLSRQCKKKSLRSDAALQDGFWYGISFFCNEILLEYLGKGKINLMSSVISSFTSYNRQL